MKAVLGGEVQALASAPGVLKRMWMPERSACCELGAERIASFS